MSTEVVAPLNMTSDVVAPLGESFVVVASLKESFNYNTNHSYTYVIYIYIWWLPKDSSCSANVSFPICLSVESAKSVSGP